MRIDRAPEWNCFICLNKIPSEITKATRSGYYTNWQTFYYCDDCEDEYNAMHSSQRRGRTPQRPRRTIKKRSD